MKTQIQNKPTRNNRRLFLTGCMVVCLAAGWILGSLTTNAFSQSAGKRSAVAKDTSTHLPSIVMNGEALPTVILSEFPVIAH